MDKHPPNRFRRGLVAAGYDLASGLQSALGYQAPAEFAAAWRKVPSTGTEPLEIVH